MNNISRNFASNNGYYGIYLFWGWSSTVSGNTVQDNYESGIGLLWSSEVFISENVINNNGKGIFLEGGWHNTIAENIISNNDIGIDSLYSECNILIDNTFIGNTINISGNPDYCYTPTAWNPFSRNQTLFEFILFLGIVVASTIYLTLMINKNKKYPYRKVIPAEKPIEEFKPKLIIPPEEKKLDIIQEEAVSVPEEIPVVEEVIKKEVSVPEEILEVPKIEIVNCQFCGMELSNDTIFCLRCGHKLKK